jgi:hypothetical protein
VAPSSTGGGCSSSSNVSSTSSTGGSTAGSARDLVEPSSVSNQATIAASRSTKHGLRLEAAAARLVAAGRRLFGGRGSTIGSSSTSPTAASSSSASSSSSSSSRRRVGGLNLAGRLAAATAAGAYIAHLDGATVHDASTGEVLVAPKAAGDNKESVGTTGTSSGSSSRSTADAAGVDTAADDCHMASPCPSNCSECCAAARVFFTLRCLECGVSLPTGSAGLPDVGDTVCPARQRGMTLQQYLQLQLLALAWRHPVPHVCGNVLCGRVKGQSAVGAVRNQVGTLCGGCRAAWHCCEGCQRAAWEAHRMACKHCK